MDFIYSPFSNKLWFSNIIKLFSNINKLFPNIKKLFFNIKKTFSNIKKSFSNIKKSFSNMNRHCLGPRGGGGLAPMIQIILCSYAAEYSVIGLIIRTHPHGHGMNIYNTLSLRPNLP